jgi:hypothetical protein
MALRKIAIKAIRITSASCTASTSGTTSSTTSLIKHNKREVTIKNLSINPIQIVDIKSAEERVVRWINQQQQFEQVELAVKAYKFFHRMNLIYIYEDFKAYVVREYGNDADQQEILERQLERNIFCALQQIVPRTERRRKESAIRIRCLIDAGITFDQIVSVGMSVTDFEADNLYFNKFILALNLQVF